MNESIATTAARRVAIETLLTPQEAADLVGVSVDTIRAGYRSGSLTAYQPTRKGRVKIPISALESWLERPASRERDVEREQPGHLRGDISKLGRYEAARARGLSIPAAAEEVGLS